MGGKIEARATAVAAGVAVVPGTDGPVDLAGARAFATEHGFPIAVKAAAGGGGRGFRVARSADEVEDAFNGASGEAQRYFNNPVVYVERYFDHPRHIEIQVMADRHGNVVGLGERDCSIQRRHQKLVEESPSPAITHDIRAAMNATAEQLARAVGYVSAGTCEFLFQDDQFYFLEMNTRIQVEHPVTEWVTGIDLVREQLRVARGEPLSFAAGIEPRGHAIECRINAEDPARDFQPTPGPLLEYVPPAGHGVRVDTGFTAGGAIDPRFDSLIAKLIVWGRDRTEALSRLDRALADFRVIGVATTIPLYRALVRHPEFAAGDYDTKFLDRTGLTARVAPFEPPPALQPADGVVVVEVDGRPYRVKLPEGFGAIRPRSGAQPARRSGRGGRGTAVIAPTGNTLVSPIQGTVLSVAVEQEAAVEAGQLVCVVEAMKMENEIVAHQAGKIAELHVQAGQQVQVGAPLAVIEPV
jgi:acetyl-CoA/propionyl-CoA carboxylase biotin carboxyl carrier protein